MESALTTRAPRRRAVSTARRVLPLAVGPAIRTACFPAIACRAPMSVLCLIANPAEPVLTPALVESVQRETHGEINWLAQGIACEIVSPSDPKPVETARDVLGPVPVDVALLPRANRKKLLLVADMDSTMIEQECIDELADALGLKDRVAEITDRAMRGELDFRQALQTRVALLEGLERRVIEDI